MADEKWIAKGIRVLIATCCSIILQSNNLVMKARKVAQNEIALKKIIFPHVNSRYDKASKINTATQMMKPNFEHSRPNSSKKNALTRSCVFLDETIFS